MGIFFNRKISESGNSRTTRTLNKRTGKFTSTTTSKSQRAAKKTARKKK